MGERHRAGGPAIRRGDLKKSPLLTLYAGLWGSLILCGEGRFCNAARLLGTLWCVAVADSKIKDDENDGGAVIG